MPWSFPITLFVIVFLVVGIPKIIYDNFTGPAIYRAELQRQRGGVEKVLDQPKVRIADVNAGFAPSGKIRAMVLREDGTTRPIFSDSELPKFSFVHEEVQEIAYRTENPARFAELRDQFLKENADRTTGITVWRMTESLPER